MKKYISMLILMLVVLIIISGCSNNSNQSSQDIEIAKQAILSFYEKKFIVIPIECIKYSDFDSNSNKYIFNVEYNSVEIHPELYDENDDAIIINEMIYVEKQNQYYYVYNDSDECVYTYFEKNSFKNNVSNSHNDLNDSEIITGYTVEYQ